MASIDIILSKADFHDPFPVSYKIVSSANGEVEEVFKKNEKGEWEKSPKIKDSVQFISNEVVNIEKILSNKQWIDSAKSSDPQSLILNVNSSDKKYEYSFPLNKTDLNRQEKRIEAWFNLIMEKEKRVKVYEYMDKKKKSEQKAPTKS